MIVVDASAIVDALVDTDRALAVLDEMDGEDLHAPALLDFEVVSALRGHVLGRLLTRVRAEEAIENFTRLTIERHHMTDGLTEIIRLRHNFTAYDAAYVVLAHSLDATLLTTDEKLEDARTLGADVRVVR